MAGGPPGIPATVHPLPQALEKTRTQLDQQARDKGGEAVSALARRLGASEGVVNRNKWPVGPVWAVVQVIMNEPATLGHSMPAHYAAAFKTLIETANRDILKKEQEEAHEAAQQIQSWLRATVDRQNACANALNAAQVLRYRVAMVKSGKIGLAESHPGQDKLAVIRRAATSSTPIWLHDTWQITTTQEKERATWLDPEQPRNQP